jgi:hypothetical protein
MAPILLLASASVTPAQTLPPALTSLNNAFRAAYAEARTRTLAETGPTLIVNGDNLSLLLRGGRRFEANAGAPIYDPVKTIAHIPLAIFVILTPSEDGRPVDEARLKSLAGLRKLIPPAEASLDTRNLSPATLARQKQIVSASLAFLEDVAGKGTFERSALLAFVRGLAPLVTENVTEATRAQIDAIHSQVTAWRRDLSPEDWNRLHVLIIGPHMPRQDYVAAQYFLRLLHESGEGHRIVYAESLWEEPKAIELLGTHLLDSTIGEAFFGDRMRMHRDLLGDAAREYLSLLLPPGK